MLERVLKFSLTHRYFILVTAIGIAFLGAMSLRSLKIDAVPDITNNQVVINTSYPSFSPAEIEQQVTFPIEAALAGTPGLENTRSLSRNGFSQVTAIFRDDVDVYFARQQVTERLGQLKEELPPGTEPTLGAIATGLGEVCTWSVTFAHPHGTAADASTDGGWQADGSYLTPEGEVLRSEVEFAAYLRTVQDWIVRPQLRMVPGVAEVEAIGGFEKQYLVQPDIPRLTSYGLGLNDLVTALEANNQSVGGGYVERGGESYVVRMPGRLHGIDEIEQVTITTRVGVPVRVEDVAAVQVGGELRTGAATVNGAEAVLATALMLIGENSRTVAEAVEQRLEQVRPSLPPDVKLTLLLSRKKLVDSTIHTVGKNLLEGALLVAVVLFLLLGNLRAALIVAAAIPLSMLLTAMGMVRLNVSGNLMSLGAIDFGLIVDGAVIIIENCIRRIALRQEQLGRTLSRDERLTEAGEAAREMLRPSAFGQAIIIMVYVPILTLTGVEGKMFYPMAITVVFALASAFVLSLTLIPALAAILLAGRVREREVPLLRLAHSAYAPMLRISQRLPVPVIAVAALILVGAALLFTTLGQEFVPTLDEGDFDILTARIPSTSLTQATNMQTQIERALLEFPEVEAAYSKTGTPDMASDPLAPSDSDTFAILKPRGEWPEPTEPKDELRQRIEERLAEIPGINYEYSQPIEDRFNEMISGVRSDVAIKVYGDDYADMLPTAERVASVLRALPGAGDVKVEQVNGLPTMDVLVDRNAAAQRGLTLTDVQEVASIGLGGKQAGVIMEGDKRFPVVVRMDGASRMDQKAILGLPVALKSNTDHYAESFVPLSEVASVKTAEGLNQVSRENSKRRIVVQANVRGRDLGGFVDEAKSKLEAQLRLPPGQWLEWGGQFQNLLAARERLLVVVPVCLLMIFVLLVSTFGAARNAALVFSGIPFALCGGVLALWAREMPFSISAAVGFIALSGVAVLNGVVMITCVEQLRKSGTRASEAIRRGCELRLRPVLMTALVASLGFLPMALATGAGAEVQRPLATVVIGGILSSTVLTLVVLPALYALVSAALDPGHDGEEVTD